jgi:hypothetical protein
MIWLLDAWSGVQIMAGAIIFLLPKCPDWLWVPPNLLVNGFSYSYLDTKFSAYLHLLLRLRVRGSMLLLPPICLQGMGRDSCTLLFAHHRVSNCVRVKVKFALEQATKA